MTRHRKADANVTTSMEAVFKAIPARVTATNVQVELRVAKQTWLKLEYIGLSKLYAKKLD